MSTIHPTAIVDREACLGEGVEIGPYCTIGPQVTLGDRARLVSHVVVEGHTRIGGESVCFPFASIGTCSQDLKYDGGVNRVEIGARTTVREYATVNAATAGDGVTRVGSDCLIMAYAHVAHNCVLGDGVILANCGTLGGHVFIEEQAIVGGLCGIHQFVRIGRMAMVGCCSKVTQDVPPFMLADGNPLAVRGPNSVGLQRRGMSKKKRALIKQAYRILYRRGLATPRALDALEAELPDIPELVELADFVRASERGMAK